jgi:hypothetical protein
MKQVAMRKVGLPDFFWGNSTFVSHLGMVIRWDKAGNVGTKGSDTHARFRLNHDA